MQLRQRRKKATTTTTGTVASAAVAAATAATAAATVAAAATGAAVGGRARGNGAPARQQFALTPYQAINGVIDYTTVGGRKYYEKATTKLSEEGFDCQTDSLRSFIKDLERRSEAFGWSNPADGILFIPDQVPNANHKTNLLRSYGEIDIDTIFNFEETYIDKRNRQAQDTRMLYECIMNTLTKDAKNMITIWEDDFFVGNLPSGNLLFKVVLRESHIDTNATISTILTRLSSLDQYMVTIHSNIKKFNIYVKQQVDGLYARGQTTNDLLSNLFKGYLAASDRQFTAYIKTKLERYEEGQDTSANDLMIMAKVKYQIIVDKGEWNAPSPEETQILALKAEINTMKSASKKQPRKGNKPNNKNSKENPKPSNRKPDWMFREPEQSEIMKPKTWNNNQWWFCGKKTGGQCEQYRQHKGKDCQGKSYFATQKRKHSSDDDNKETKEDPPKNKIKKEKEPRKPTKQLKLATALSNIVHENESDEDSED